MLILWQARFSTAQTKVQAIWLSINRQVFHQVTRATLTKDKASEPDINPKKTPPPIHESRYNWF